MSDTDIIKQAIAAGWTAEDRHAALVAALEGHIKQLRERAAIARTLHPNALACERAEVWTMAAGDLDALVRAHRERAAAPEER